MQQPVVTDQLGLEPLPQCLIARQPRGEALFIYEETPATLQEVGSR